MSDTVTKEVRSRIMSSIRSKNTKPEIQVRKILWTMGKRYRIHDKTICGTPDISNKKKNLVVFIDGCFWHGCRQCTNLPKTNGKFWRNKIRTNKKRRKNVSATLKKENWNILTFWEHEIEQDPLRVCKKIAKIL